MGAAPQVVIVAGEASGDLHGADLIKTLRQLLPNLKCTGIGGPGLAAQGVELLYRAEDLSVVGIAEVLPKAGRLLGALRGLKRHLRRTRPDLLILIDFPDFNFRLGKAARRLGIKVLYYISPQVWAWRQGRARTMESFVDRLAVVFPFEKEFMARAAPGLDTTFVGHPSLDRPDNTDKSSALPVPAEAELVGLLPGSRMSEISRLLPLMLKAAEIMNSRRSGLHFILPLAPGVNSAEIDPYLKNHPRGLSVVQGLTSAVMAQARILLVASGTATLQAALAGTPMVVVYKVGWFNYCLARLMIKVDYIAMPNLIAGREVVPELIQSKADPQTLAEWGLDLLADGPQRQDMVDALGQVRHSLGGAGANQRVAEMALELMGRGG
ncbi:MAG: lipid-A-disaccharide synthase [Desulfarculaceae bacterium]